MSFVVRALVLVVAVVTVTEACGGSVDRATKATPTDAGHPTRRAELPDASVSDTGTDASVGTPAGPCADACNARATATNWCDPSVDDRRLATCSDLCASYYPGLDSAHQSAMVTCLQDEPLCFVSLDECIDEHL